MPTRSGVERDLEYARSVFASSAGAVVGDHETVIDTQSTVDPQEDFDRKEFLRKEKEADEKAKKRGY
jgi:hypothetical protein